MMKSSRKLWKTEKKHKGLTFGTEYGKLEKTMENGGNEHMDWIPSDRIPEFSNTGVVSRQLLNPDHSASTRVTMTEVHLASGACQPRHTHETSEQIWYATKGSGTLLLADDREQPFHAGDVVRFAEGDVHGLRNDGEAEFVYISVTTPPIHFGYAYRNRSEKR